MTPTQPPITATTHPLPFHQLSPRDFERLCLWLVGCEGYERAEHLGAAGSEQGRDLVAWRGGRLWAFQCKRVQTFGPKDALAELDKILALRSDQRPAELVFIVTCDVFANTRQQVRDRCADQIQCHFWTGTELDLKVKRHPDILAEFFHHLHRGDDLRDQELAYLDALLACYEYWRDHWGNDPDPNRANYDETGIGTTSAVGCFPDGASLYDVEDLSGNVLEWCRTKWDDNYEDYRNDDALEGNAARVLRGGAFGNYRGSSAAPPVSGTIRMSVTTMWGFDW